MNGLFMLDTNTVSYILKGKSAAARLRLIDLRDGETACISAITEAELLYGMKRSNSGVQRQQALDFFLARMRIMNWGRDEAGAYAHLRARQEAMGKPLGPLDTLIAAHALALDAIVITSDRAFRQVDQLRTENWAVDL